ncbi:MAG TPA: hypothetical protein P5202_02965 [Methanomassiliicoccales archaeon]|nr:hypothetical protein [Methanomassiliicoccales archaeon]HSA35505.1 hypothetical protein [Methanomassiliicoccales archaeon]
MMLEKLFDTPEKRARLVRYAWLISLLMLLLGYGLMVLFWDY